MFLIQKNGSKTEVSSSIGHLYFLGNNKHVSVKPSHTKEIKRKNQFYFWAFVL